MRRFSQTVILVLLEIRWKRGRQLVGRNIPAAGHSPCTLAMFFLLVVFFYPAFPTFNYLFFSPAY